MSVAEMKEEAIRQFAMKVEATEDESVLVMILDFLRDMNAPPQSDMNLSRHYDNIKARYGSVLRKLAE